MGTVSLASVLPGSGLALRRGRLSAVIDGIPADRAAALLAVLAEAEPAAIAAVIGQRLADTGDTPALAVLVDAGDHLDLFVAGLAAVLVDAAGESQIIRASVETAQTHRVAAGARVTLIADGGAGPSSAIAEPTALLSFDAGMVPARGLVIWTVVAAVGDSPTELAVPQISARLDDPADWDSLDTSRKPLAQHGTSRVEGQRRRAAAPTLVPPSDDIPETGDADADLANARTQVSAVDVASVQPVAQLQIHGLLCPNGHINDPRLQFCARCGIRIDRMTGALVQGPRPPLGLLVIDDGATYVVSSDLLIGRDPEPTAERRGGIAADGVGPLNSIRLADNSGAMSRAHCEIRLVEWDVRLLDAGSVNGTFVWLPGQQGWRRPAPGQDVPLVPGAQIRIGNRAMLFESPHGTAHSSSGPHQSAPIASPPPMPPPPMPPPAMPPPPMSPPMPPQPGPPPGYGPPPPVPPPYGPPPGYGPPGYPNRWTP